MGKRKRNMQLPALAALLSVMVPTVVMSALLDVGPIVPQVINSTPPQHGFPLWYRDTNRVPLEICLSRTASVNGPMCLTQEPFTALPLSFPDNFGPEAFWWSADAQINMPGGGRARLVMGLEAAFAVGDPVPGDQVSFARVRIRIDTPVTGTYVVTYPYGQMTFNVTDAGDGIDITKDIGIAVNSFDGALRGEIGPFLYWDTGPISVAGEWFVGDPNVDHRVVGSPFPDPLNQGQFSNFFRIQGPAAVGTLQTDLFAVMGKIYTDPISTPLAVDRVTYTRNSAGTLVSSFATSEALSNQTNPSAPFPENFALTGAPSTLEVTGTGIPTQSMGTNNPSDGKFFSTTGVFANPASLPPSIVVTNTADTPPTTVTVPLVDDVTISQATYRPLNKTLSIIADSADDIANPALLVFMPGMVAPLGTLSNGQLSVTFPVTDSSVTPAKIYEIPPVSITVKSAGGGEATVPVSVAEVVDLPPTGSIVINSGAKTTGSTTVTLTLAATDDSGSVTHMSFSKDNVYYFPF